MNKAKFDQLRELNLPLGHYIIIGSGAMCIRNLKPINDIDILVSDELWGTLASKYRVTYQNNVKAIKFSGGLIEAFCKSSFHDYEEKEERSISERIKNAEIIEGLPFDSIDHVLHYKRERRLEKDLKDIEAIEMWLKEKS